MPTGTGTALVPVAPAAAFAALADPRHAPGWFAGVEFAEAPRGSPRVGMRWVFRQVQRGGRLVPTAMVRYEPPRCFAWETERRPRRDSIRWELCCEEAPVPTDDGSLPGTRLQMTIVLRPGWLGWLSVLLGYPFVRKALDAQALHAVERARDWLATLPGTAPRPRPAPRRR